MYAMWGIAACIMLTMSVSRWTGGPIYQNTHGLIGHICCEVNIPEGNALHRLLFVL
jgi:hypothetical protein